MSFYSVNLFLFLSVALLSEHTTNAWITRSSLRMDVETPPMHTVNLPLFQESLPVFEIQLHKKPTFSKDECTYMPFYKWQLSYFETHLTNFRELSLPNPALGLVESDTTRVMTRWFASDEYRLIRLTYMDAGEQTQVFTSVCYPRDNLPIMGSGLLQCGETRIAICDYQPLEKSHEAYANDLLKPIQERFPSLQEEMSDRFFDQDKFWSKSTLIGRFPLSSDLIWEDVLPAYKSFVKTHVELTTQCKGQATSGCNQQDLIDQVQSIVQHHSKYDTHVASRDPAIRMLSSIFGADLADDIVYDTLFPLATR